MSTLTCQTGAMHLGLQAAGLSASAYAATVTSPRYLVELGWSSTVYLSTRDTVMYDGHTWVNSGVTVTSLTGGNAEQRASLALPNHDNTYSALALSEGLQDITVKIYQLYGSSSVDWKATLLFDGAMDGGTVDSREVRIDCLSLRGATMYAPRLVLQPPLCNHNRSAGSTLRWNNETYLLERR